MESHTDFLSYLAILSFRSLCLAILTWLALRVFRVKSASAKHAVWTVVTAVMLLQVVVSPGLPPLPIRILPAAVYTGPGLTPQLPAEQTFAGILNGRLPDFTWTQIVLCVYAVVAVVLFVRLIIGYRFTRRLVGRSRPIGELPANPAAQLRESDWISVPMTVGQIAPNILLPVGWREWDPAKLRSVVAHEEAHVRRADWATGVMARVNCCVFWFHPLAWWLKRQLAVLAEYACDDSVLAEVGDRQQYARTLLEIVGAMKSAQGRLIGDAVSMAKETNVRNRMDQILDETRTIPPAFGRSGWVTLLVCCLPLAYLASTIQLARAQTPAANPYQRWVDEEVLYIISLDERSAFNRLTSDQERQHFIEQFWLRRDPTPGTEENEFMEEHYRRIAFANDHFTEAIPGWKTDRGAIYIKYGLPDVQEFEVSPSTYPHEKWRYRFIEAFGPNVEFEFVDPTKTGRFHLTQDPSEKEVRR